MSFDRTGIVEQPKTKAHTQTAGYVEYSDLGLKSKPLISVIIPVFQEEKILESTLKVYNKEIINKYQMEVIVSDGGSSDKSVEIAKKYSDIVVVHKHQCRQTISEGRNAGAKVARGNTLVFINADTIPKDIDDFFQYIYKWSLYEKSNSDCSALACKVTVAPDEIIFKDKLFYISHNFYVKLLNLIKIGMGRGECQIVRSDCFKKIGGYDTNIVAGEDFDLYRRLAKIGSVVFTDKIVVYESPRRFRKYGYLKVLWSWTLNSISVIFRGRSVSDVWEAVR